MGLSRTALYYRKNEDARQHRLKQQARYASGNGSKGSKSKASLLKYKRTLEAWKRKNKGSKPSGIAEAVHTKGGQIRWAAGAAARKHNRGYEVRERNAPSNPAGGAKKRA